MQSGALNTNRITIRGIGNRSPFSTSKIKSYLDDIPLTNGVGETTIEDLNLSGLSSIQVWRGPTASQYGAGLGGLIHLKSPVFEAHPDVLSLKSSIGSFGNYNFSNHFTLSNKESLLYFQQQYIHSDGFRDNNNYDKWHLNTLYKRKINKSELHFFINHIELKAEIPSALNLDDYLNNPRKAADNWAAVNGFEDYKKSQIASSSRTYFDNGNELRLSLHASKYDAYESRPFNILKENSHFLGGRGFYHFGSLFNLDVSMNFGTEFFFEKYNWRTFETEEGDQGPMINDMAEKRSFQNLFNEFEWKLDNWRIYSGLSLQNILYKRTDLKNNLQSKKQFKLSVNPRLSISHSHHYRFNTYFTVSRGISQVSLEESLLPDGQINPDIELEKGWNFEIGQRGIFSKYGIEYELTIYAMYIADMLVSQRTADDAYFGVNAGSSSLKGIEFMFHKNFSLNRKWTSSSSITYGFSDHKFQNFVHEDIDFSSNIIPGSAKHKLNISQSFQMKKLGINLKYLFVDKYPINDGNTVFNDAYQLIDIEIFKLFQLKKIKK